MEGYFKQDDSCHWYFIPKERSEEWDKWISTADYEEDDRFNACLIGGGIENILITNNNL